MKKLLIALLALSVAGTAFAADPAFTLSGALKTGLTFTSSDVEGVQTLDKDGEEIEAADGAVYLKSDDVGDDVPVRVELVGTYTDGDFGVKFRFRSNYEDPLNFSYAYAWGNLFSNMVTFKVGKVDDGAWATEGDEGFDVADGNGLLVQVKPMAGLNVGVKFAAPALSANGAWFTDADDAVDSDGDGETDNDQDSANYYTYAQFISESALGIGYTSDLFNFQAGYKMDSSADDAKDADYDSNAYAMAYFGASYKGMKALTAKAEARFGALGAADYSWKEFNEIVEYAVNDQISAGLVAWQTMFSEFYTKGATKDAIWDVADDGLLYSVKPYANYKLNDKTTLGLAITYAAQGDASEITVKPSATVQLGAKAKFVGFFAYDTLDLGLDNVDPVNTQTVQLDFIYSF